jgi:SNF2 family DNA or RNA helicase
MSAPPLFDHQKTTVEFYNSHPHVLNHSDPGTGKTRGYLEWFRGFAQEHKKSGLVICPKSIMRAAWAQDAARFTPELRISVATAENRTDALRADADLYILNTDGVRALEKNPGWLPKNLGAFCIDESTSFKNPSSLRTKAAIKVLEHIEHRVTMTGTPTPQGLLDLWSQVYLTDKGERLGDSFYRYRASTCDPINSHAGRQFTQWVPKPGMAEALADLLNDITIRYKLESCIDMPERVEYTVTVTPPEKLTAQYETFKRHARLVLNDVTATAIHAAALRAKLLQIMSGALYSETGEPLILDTERYDLILDLVEARPASLVAFNWAHQKTQLVERANKRGLKFGVIDGSVSMEHRTRLVNQFQAGELQTIFAHPATAGHGLTLTRGTAIIWSSPTDNAEYWTQFNARIYRAGQTQRTEIIKLVAEGTVEERAYDNLKTKVDAQNDFLTLATS